ncbi:MAG: peptidoglycan editing factor PgeF [Nitrospinota bacterium]|nr:peptidoglycan editing factor PgeF [Nitrospinota bacterium]MDH5677557.1 peptidoglycan editing factor PgeF [Nitrospinota bacterium]
MSDILVRKGGGGPEIYIAPLLADLGFEGFFTGRGGGVSDGAYSSLNVGAAVGDTPAHVEENLQRIRQSMGIKELWSARQVHGDHVSGISSWPPSRKDDADALVVSVPGVTASVTVADCLPLILVDPVKKVAAVAHAGRKGTELHITRKTLLRMGSWFDCQPVDVVAVLGPCIRACCYQVDEKTAEGFHSCCGGNGGRMLDIARANRDQLLGEGVAQRNIHDCGICTSCEKERFFSHRGHHGTTGRFLCAVSQL